MLRRGRLGLVPALALLFAFVPAARAQEGLELDPDSPAGVEYALPLDKARQDASGGTRGRSRSIGDAALVAPAFGVGVTPRSGSGPDAGPVRAGSDEARDGDRLEGPAENDQVPAAAAIPDDDSGGSAPVVLALLVVLGGGALGLLVRRLRRPPAT